MSTSDPNAGHPDFSMPFDRARAMELLWENSLLHRKQTGGEIMIPFNVVALIGEDNLNVIHERLRVLTGREVERHNDFQFSCVRLIPKEPLDLPVIEDWARTHISKQLHEAASQGMNLYPDLQKIPRPSNMFILYRQHHHKPVTAKNPGVPNTAISRIIADMWRHETQAVKDEYKMLARMAKEAHAAKYPDYQYAPRRPHERLRRRPRIHPSALTWMYGTQSGAAVLEKANSRPKADGWIPVTRALVQELDSRHVLLGPHGLGPPPIGPTQGQFQELVQSQVQAGADNPQLPEADQEDHEPLLEALDDDFFEELLNFEDA